MSSGNGWIVPKGVRKNLKRLTEGSEERMYEAGSVGIN